MGREAEDPGFVRESALGLIDELLGAMQLRKAHVGSNLEFAFIDPEVGWRWLYFNQSPALFILLLGIGTERSSCRNVQFSFWEPDSAGTLADKLYPFPFPP